MIFENRYILTMNSEDIPFSIFKPNSIIELSIFDERVRFYICLLLKLLILSILGEEYASLGVIKK